MNILDHAGKFSHDPAKERAEAEEDAFQKNRLKTYESDFDRLVKKIEAGKKQHKDMIRKYMLFQQLSCFFLNRLYIF
ncbi:MAG: hypothetical protein GF353_16515 [Candidatus Lokiarchaeota archaeon]|nr:hypothetical protein [Candidatus Lokiarchaeota archaeon]